MEERIRLLRIVVGLVLLVSSTAGSAEEKIKKNLAPNGSFEIDEDNDGIPDGWKVSGGKSILDEEEKQDGKNSLQVVNTEGSSYTVVSLKIILKPNTAYRCTAYGKCHTAGHHLLRIYDSCMCTYASQGTGWARISEWHRFELVFRTDKRTVYSIGLYAPIKGTTWWDNVVLEELTEEKEHSQIGDTSPTVNKELPPLRIKENKRGYLVFAKDICERISSRYIPSREEIDRKISVFASPGEWENITVMVHAIRNLKGLQVSFATPFRRENGQSIHLELVNVRYAEPFKRELSTFVYERYPLVLLPLKPLSIEKGDTAQFWLTVKIPEEASAGIYQGKLRLKEKDNSPFEIPLELEVLPIKLLKPDISYFMFYNEQYNHPEYSSPNYQRKYFQDMAEHGMTTTTLYVVPEYRKDGRYQATLEYNDAYMKKKEDHRYKVGLEQMMEMVQEAGLFKTPILIAGATGIMDWGIFRGGDSSVKELISECKRIDLPAPLFYVHDEPSTLPKIKFVLNAFKNIYSKVPEATTITAGGDFDIVGHLYDIWMPSHNAFTRELISRAKEMNKELWMYDCQLSGKNPETERYLCGLFTWRTGVKGLGQWCYIDSKQYLDREGKIHYANYGYVIPGVNGPNPLIGWEARREGIDDYRYLLTLTRMLDRFSDRKPISDAVKKTEQFLNELKELVPLDSFSKGKPGSIKEYAWDFDPAVKIKPGDYTKLRRRAADCIIALEKILAVE